MIEVLASSVGAFATVIAVVVAVLAHRMNKNVQSSADREKAVTTAIGIELKPFETKLAEIGTVLSGITTSLTHQSGEIEKGSTRIGSLMDRTAVLETKVELWWKAIANDAAKILHQPDPRRAHIDTLLEAFMSGRLTGDQETELRGYLRIIRDYEPGQVTDFPVRDGEQMPASILLSTMEHTLNANAK